MAKNLLPNQKPLVLAVFVALNCSSVSDAAVNFTGAYSQTFDSLTTSTSATAWTNDVTLSGWHLFNQANAAITAYTGSTGSASAGSFYSYGAVSDRALGGLGSGGAYFGAPASGAVAGWIAFSAVNSTGSTINQVNVAFDGEQWRNGGNTSNQNMVLEYGFGTAFSTVATWTAPSGNFDWTSPIASATAASVDGNSAGLVSNRGGTLTGLNWTNGNTLWLRWVERNDAGNDHGLAIDNFSLTSTTSSVLLSINDVSTSEGNSGTTNYTFTVSLSAPAPAGGVSFDIATADNTASSASGDYVSKSLASQTIPAGSDRYTFTVAVNGDTSIEPNETFVVNITNVVRATVLDAQGQGTIQNDDVAAVCSESDTAIGAIQGSGETAALTGTRTVQGVVVGDYEGASPNLRGFYLQNTPAQSDGDDATSDGIFVFNGSNNSVNLGQVVQVTGTVEEFQGQTQLSSPTIVSCGETATITPVNVTLPVASQSYLERYEGMLVKFAQTLLVTEHFQLGRFGQVVLSANSRLAQPTNVNTPGTSALALQASNSLNRIIVDDELQSQNPDPILFGRNGNPLSASNTLRGGDSVANLVGVMTYTWSGNSASGNAYRLRPINSLNASVPNFVASNLRPAAPAQLTGRLKVASANLLNFFNTFGSNNCTNGVGGAATDCRGAENQTEFDRQWPKTVANLIGTGADVIIVNELENDGYGANSAMQFLVNKMNAVAGAGSYAFIDVDANTGQTNALGTDAIKVGMIYQRLR
ncbi:ExeM/NucH family extracellular endonuclease [Methylocucumis oryzae]|uniref:ExeM/NucH family extracellular endonuclease n=1 Tax=Methylocucumis oryzae TaxID=1632867 RepID=UPI000AB6BF5E|nr:ExeM/NucH family extracellular endonuclease [Methylocucumis oryzae]